MYADLRDLLAELPHRGDARVLVLTGEGRGFCSGGDVEEIIGELQRMAAGELLEFTRMSGAVVKAMRECPLPIVAAVNGVAAGRRLRDRARERLPAAGAPRPGSRSSSRGSGWPAQTWAPPTSSRASSGSGARPSCSCSATRSRPTAPSRSGSRAGSSDDAALPAASELAPQLADGPALAYSTTKLLLTRELDLDLGGAIELEALAQALLMKSDDLGEFYAAWTEGRKPAWTGASTNRQPARACRSRWASRTRSSRGGAVYLAGQVGEGASIAEQFDSAAGKLVVALRAAGGEPDQLVSLVVYVTDVDEYRASLSELGEVWRRHFGRHYPAMALVGVTALFEPEATSRADGRGGPGRCLTSCS